MNKIDINNADFNPFNKIGKEWMLLTAGDKDKFNTMTASWGFAGVIWGKNAVEVVVRHSRYTYEFTEQGELFTLSFYDEKYRDALKLCGTVSGREHDKPAEAGLTPVEIDGTMTFKEAYLTLVCRKMYAADIDVAAVEEAQRKWYDGDAVHKMYIAEITAAYMGE